MITPPSSTAMFPGWLGDFVEASAESTEAHPACVGIHLLIGLGNAIGRGPHVMVGATRHALNEFALVVGSTSVGRKGDGKNVALRPLLAADDLWQVASGLSSGEGLIYSVRDSVLGIDKKTGERVVLDAGVDDKRLLIVEPEFSQALKMFRREGNILSNVLRDAWDSATTLRTLTKTSPSRATDAHISLVAHSTREDLRAYLADLDVANGVANRFLFTAAKRARVVPTPIPLAGTVIDPVVEQIRAVLTHAQGVGRLERTALAEAEWRRVYPQLTAERAGLSGALLARGVAHVTRLSALFALLRQAPVVDLPDLRAALAWWEYAAASVGIIFDDRTGNHDADKIKHELLPGDQMDWTTLRQRVFSNHITTARLKDALELLVALGGWRVWREETGGRPRYMVQRLPDAAATSGGA